jgi:carboxylate-amine ligase
MNTLPPFKKNSMLTIGVELELQLLNLQNFNLAVEAEDLLRRLLEAPHSGEIKPEITKAMIEINSSIHSSYPSLCTELRSLRNIIVQEANKTHIGICGGGAHPFQKWKEQRIFPTERFASIAQQYGYLAKQFTVFGQHIHIACPNGDDALYLCHAMARYIPHFIALSAASPFHQGIDTAFDCSRLTMVSAFPLSGTPPWLHSWIQFEEYFEKMFDLGIIKSMKDFYWDIRPKPEYGTVELRVCDTPLSVEKAAQLAGYAQALACWLLQERQTLSQDIYLTYAINRFRAARYGLQAMMIEPVCQKTVPLITDILTTCDQLKIYAAPLNSLEAIEYVRQAAQENKNDARWLREKYAALRSLTDTVRAQSELWMKVIF